MTELAKAVKHYAKMRGIPLTDGQTEAIAELHETYSAAGWPGFAESLLDLLARWNAEDILAACARYNK